MANDMNCVNISKRKEEHLVQIDG